MNSWLWIIIALAVVGLAVFIGVRQEQVVYNEYTFTTQNGQWHTMINGEPASFTFTPDVTDTVPVFGTLPPTWGENIVFVSFSPEGNNLTNISLVATNIFTFGNLLNITPVIACQSEHESCEGRPIVTCDSTGDIILLTETGQTSVNIEGNCITVSGDIVLASERLLYGLLDISPLNKSETQS